MIGACWGVAVAGLALLIWVEGPQRLARQQPFHVGVRNRPVQALISSGPDLGDTNRFRVLGLLAWAFSHRRGHHIAGNRPAA